MAAAVVATPLPLNAQGRVHRDAGPVAMLVASTPAQWLAGGALGWRLAPRTRLGGVLVAGGAGGRGVARGEVSAHFLLNPAGSHGVGVYGGGGVAVSTGPIEGGRILVLLGMESAPGAAAGWIVEVGLGGGARLAAGWRWRSRRR